MTILVYLMIELKRRFTEVLCLAMLFVLIPAAGARQFTEQDLNAVVIERLNIDSISSGIHYFRFQAGTHNTGAAIWVPVLVVKGGSPGPKMLLTAAVHGDELNGIAVIHRLIHDLDVPNLKGTLVAVPGINQPGLSANNRHFVGADGGGFMTDLNRIFPGRNNGGTPERYVSALWENILDTRFDLAVDLHTQTRGTAYPLFVFADFRIAQARQMAFDLMPDLIKNDPGQDGTIETTLNKSGVPTVTLEIGSPKKWQPDLIDRAATGIHNIMVRAEMLPGVPDSAKPAPFVGASTTNIHADVGGFAYLSVSLMDKVVKGQEIAVMVDAFGRELARYKAPHDGIVLSIATDPLREPGAMLVRILQ